MKNELVKFSNKYQNFYEVYNYIITKENKVLISVGVTNEFAFIEVIFNNDSYYYKYNLNNFYFDTDSFYINIENNFFTKDSVTLDLKGDACIKGRLNFYDHYLPKVKNFKTQHIFSYMSKTRGSLLINDIHYSLDDYTMSSDKFYTQNNESYLCYRGVNNALINISKVNDDVIISIITNKFTSRFYGKYEIKEKMILVSKKYRLELSLFNAKEVTSGVSFTSLSSLVKLMHENEVLLHEGILLHGVKI